MSGSLNEATLIGNVTKDPEIRKTQSGKPVASFSLATNETWKTADGERKERAEFHRVVVFNEGLCGVVEKYVRKGAKLFVRGQLQTRKWEKDGVEKYSTEVVLQGFNGTLTMLDGANGSTRAENSNVPDEEPRRERPKTAGSGQGTFSKTLDDDAIPFVMEWR